MDLQSTVIAIIAVVALFCLLAFGAAFAEISGNLGFPRVFSRTGLIGALLALLFSWHELHEYHELGKAAVVYVKVQDAVANRIGAYERMGMSSGVAEVEEVEHQYHDAVGASRE